MREEDRRHYVLLYWLGTRLDGGLVSVHLVVFALDHSVAPEKKTLSFVALGLLLQFEREEYICVTKWWKTTRTWQQNLPSSSTQWGSRPPFREGTSSPSFPSLQPPPSRRWRIAQGLIQREHKYPCSDVVMQLDEKLKLTHTKKIIWQVNLQQFPLRP